MQTDEITDYGQETVQESGSQTDVDSLTWVETWIESTMQILNTIEEISLTTDNCLDVLQDLQNIENEFYEHLNSNPEDEKVKKKLKSVQEKTTSLRDATLQTCHWDELVKLTIESKNEDEIKTLLTLIPQGAPHSRKLKEALKNLPKVRKCQKNWQNERCSTYRLSKQVLNRNLIILPKLKKFVKVCILSILNFAIFFFNFLKILNFARI